MSDRTPLSSSSSSSQHYHHQNQNPTSSTNKQQASPMAANGANIRCPTCGCLNFSTETTCEPCRQNTSGSFSSAVAATGSSSTSKASSVMVPQPVSPRTAILKKQTLVPQPRTGIVTGLRTGLPIDAYRSGGRRNSKLGTKITRDGELPASSQSVSTSETEQRATNGSSSSAPAAHGTELYRRVLAQQRESREAKRKADATSSSSSNTAAVDEKSSIVRFLPSGNSESSSATIASPASSQRRPTKRLRVATKMRSDVIDLISSSDENENENEDEENDGGDVNLVDDDSTSAQEDKPADKVQPAVTTAPAPKPPEGTEPSAPAAVPTSASMSRPDANANPVVPAQAPSEAVRIPGSVNAAVPPLPASGAAAQPKQNFSARETVISYEEDYGVAPFRSRCFPSVTFDPMDFPAGDTAAASKIRARRSSGGVDASAGSSQSSDVAEPVVWSAVVAAAPVPVHAVATPVVAPVTLTPALRVIAAPALAPETRTPAAVPPAIQPQAKQQTAPVASKPTPAPAPVIVQQRVEPPPHPVQAPTPAPAISPEVAPAVSNRAVAENPVDASASSASAAESIGSPRLKRTASGNCQEQAIELGDADESFRGEQTFSTRGELFKSRIFQSIEFNASDFSTVHDGLHVARRTKISVQSGATESQQQGTQPGVAPSQARPAPPPLSGPVTIPSAVPDRVSSRPTPIETSRSSSQAQPSALGRQVNVVPMSPRESSIWSSAPKAPVQSVVTPSAPPPSVAGVQRAPVPQQTAAQRVVPRPPTTPVVSNAVAPPVASRPAAPTPTPAASRPTAPPVVLTLTTTTAPVAFQTPVYSFGSRTTAPPVASRSTAPPSGRSTPTVTPDFSRPAFAPVASSTPSTPPVFSRSVFTPAESRPTATPVFSSRPAKATPVVTPKSIATAHPHAAAGLSSNNTNRSTEAPRAARATTVCDVPEKPLTLSATTTILLARKKLSQTAPPAATSSSSVPTSVANDVKSTATATASQLQVAKAEVKPFHVAVKPHRVPKPPLLGTCSADFMGFMKDFIDGDDDELMNDEEETRKLHMQLLEVVDLTSLTDSDDDSSDGYEFAEPPTPRSAAATATATASAIAAGLAPPLGTGLLNGGQPGLTTLSLQPPRPGMAAFVPSGPTGFFASGVAPTSQLTAAGGVLVAPKQLVVAPRPRAARQMELCVLCEKKRWVRSMIHCTACGKYYHKKCAKEYGDDKICWNCELDGMIDDSELTESSRDVVVGMLSTLRPALSSSEEEDNEDGEDEDVDGAIIADVGTVRTSGEEEEGKKETDDEGDDDEANAVARQRSNPQFPGATTKSMQRWKAFLDVSTSTVEQSFHEVTKVITEELQSEGERKAKYSKGFTTPEIFQAAISEVLDSYADLQDQLDREAREKPRGSVAGCFGPGGETQETSGAGVEAIATEASETSSAVVQPPRVILNLSGPDQPPSQLNRVVEILDA